MGMEVAELRDGGRLKDIRAFIDSLYGHDLHAKRVDSLAWTRSPRPRWVS